MEHLLSGRSTVVARKEEVSCNLAVDYGLNTLAVRIWELIQQPRTVLEIREAILQEFDVDPERWQRDLVVLLSDLAKRRLVEIEGAATA
jgi:coenzyme PQQ synthesis protein D (PqqD)